MIQNPGNQQSTVNSFVSMSVIASDPNGDALEFAAVNLPVGLTISPDGVISGTPTELNTWSVTVTVTDNISGFDSAVFDWTIVEASACADCIDFGSTTTVSFTSQDRDGGVQVLDSGQTIQISNNTWRRTEETFTITPTTVLEFTFESSQEGEIQGIGFTEVDDIATAAGRIFQLWGTQDWGIRDFTYSGTGPETFVIPVGQYYTGTDMRLTFANDDDAGGQSNGTFSLVRVVD